MTERQIIDTLRNKGLKVSDVAAVMAEEFSITERSADTMLRQLISGQAWYPKYVGWLKANYKIPVDRPQWLKPVRERMKAAA